MKNTDTVRELTLEEMIALDYSDDAIIEKLNGKLKARTENKKNTIQTAARKKVANAIKEYLVALGVPSEQIDDIILDQVFESFEKEIEPALKIFSRVPKEKKDRISLDEDALESALGALRAFADSL